MKNLFFLLFLFFATLVVAQPQSGIDHGFMGVGVENISNEKIQELKLKYTKGAIIVDVVAESSAQEAGLKVNDVIIKVKDTPVATVEEFIKERMKYKAGDEIIISYIRNGKPEKMTMKLKPAPKKAP